MNFSQILKLLIRLKNLAGKGRIIKTVDKEKMIYSITFEYDVNNEILSDELLNFLQNKIDKKSEK